MSKATVADKKPAVLVLEPGEYWWCQCGLSQTQPYCDGSHAGTEFSPLQVMVSEQRKVALCLCKQTGKAPFCDGSHNKL